MPHLAALLAGFCEAVRIAIPLVAGHLLVNATEASMQASQAPLRAGLEPAGIAATGRLKEHGATVGKAGRELDLHCGVAGMKHLGILGHSAEGAALCFLAFCQEGFRRLGPHDHPDVTLDCIALARSMPAWDEGDHATIRETLSTSVQRLARAGADFFACPDNTAHMALDRLGAELALPGLHIAEVVAEQAARDRRRRVGVLGTSYLMDGPVYPGAFSRRGIAAELPGEEDRRLVNRIIFDELVNGVVTEAARQEYLRVIGQLAARGCDAVALVCTEIPLLVTPDASPLPTLDSTRLLARAAFDVAVGHRAMPAWRGGPLDG